LFWSSIEPPLDVPVTLHFDREIQATADFRPAVGKGSIAMILVHQRAGRRAAAAVELAILLPLLAFIFVISVDFARIFYFSLTVENCARNGAHYGSGVVNINQADSKEEWEKNGGLIASITDAALADAGSLYPPLSASNVTVTSGTDGDGNPMVRVTVNYSFQTITNFPLVPQQTNLSRTAQMRVAPQAPSAN
jgi:Flp pilus assembly protein TadG